MPRPLLDYYVLDAIADDIESLMQIVPSVGRAAELWDGGIAPSDIGRQNVITSLLRLIADRCVRVLSLVPSGKELEELPETVVPAGSFDDHWFGLTPKGRMWS